MTIKDILNEFNLNADAESFGNGHINDTYIVKGNPKHTVQKINTFVFKNPEKLMDNVEAVTNHLKKKIVENGGDPERETLTVVKTKDGKNFVKDGDDCYRCYIFVDDVDVIEDNATPEDLYEAAYAYGKFMNMLADFPAHQLHETIVDFHNTVKRYNDFENSVNADKAGRAKSVAEEIKFVQDRKDYAGVVVNAMKEGKIPLKVTHNDTKLNNVLFDKKTHKGLCVIDLDTVMPGSALYDFGDALRFAGSTGSEDEQDLSKIEFDLEKFKMFTKGFIDSAKDSLNDYEIELLPFSIMLMTYECGMRFLADHLDGDVYFKVHREGHNLDRCRTQFKLVADMEAKKQQMDDIVKEIISEYR